MRVNTRGCGAYIKFFYFLLLCICFRETLAADRQYVSPAIWMDEGAIAISQDLENRLYEIVPKSLSAPWLKASGPWSITFDSSWRKTKGLTHPEMQDINGDPTILINPDDFLNDTNGYIFAHELTHIAQNRFHPKEIWWLKEGTALLSQTLLTKTPYKLIEASYQRPLSSLTRIPKKLKSDQLLPQYGHLTLYFYYLYKNCGEDQFLGKLVYHPETKKKGIDLINYLLKKTGTSAHPVCSSFQSSFFAFQRARYLQNIHKPYEFILFDQFEFTLSAQRPKLPPYSAAPYKIKNGKCDPRDRKLTPDSRLAIRLH